MIFIVGFLSRSVYFVQNVQVGEGGLGLPKCLENFFRISTPLGFPKVLEYEEKKFNCL